MDHGTRRTSRSCGKPRPGKDPRTITKRTKASPSGPSDASCRRHAYGETQAEGTPTARRVPKARLRQDACRRHAYGVTQADGTPTARRGPKARLRRDARRRHASGVTQAAGRNCVGWVSVDVVSLQEKGLGESVEKPLEGRGVGQLRLVQLARRTNDRSAGSSLTHGHGEADHAAPPETGGRHRSKYRIRAIDDKAQILQGRQGPLENLQSIPGIEVACRNGTLRCLAVRCAENLLPAVHLAGCQQWQGGKSDGSDLQQPCGSGHAARSHGL